MDKQKSIKQPRNMSELQETYDFSHIQFFLDISSNLGFAVDTGQLDRLSL
jgi:hypothetical protein